MAVTSPPACGKFHFHSFIGMVTKSTTTSLSVPRQDKLSPSSSVCREQQHFSWGGTAQQTLSPLPRDAESLVQTERAQQLPPR